MDTNADRINVKVLLMLRKQFILFFLQTHIIDYYVGFSKLKMVVPICRMNFLKIDPVDLKFVTWEFLGSPTTNLISVFKTQKGGFNMEDVFFKMDPIYLKISYLDGSFKKTGLLTADLIFRKSFAILDPPF